MNSLPYLISILIFVICLSACSKEPLDKTKDFFPPVANYEYYIEGEIDNKVCRYEQINVDWISTSNKYFIDEQETWLQAYIDSLNPDNVYWNIRISNVDIMNIQMPYELQGSEGHIFWNDQRIDNIIEHNSNCQGVNRCTFMLSSKDNVIKLISNENNVLEGLFFGKAIINGIGFQPYSDSTYFHEIKNGKFKIKYRIE